MKKKILYSLFIFLLPVFNLFAQEEKPDHDPYVMNWKLDAFHYLDTVSIDTNWNSFYILNPVYKKSASNVFLGHIASPAMSHDFFKRGTGDYFFLDPFKDYLKENQDITYYNTRRPFTDLEYSTSTGDREKLEQTIHVIHTQNVNPDLNIGMDYELFSDRGQYPYKNAKTVATTFFSNYINPVYRYHTNVTFNNIGPYKDNGGLFLDDDLNDEELEEDFLKVNLEEAKVQIKNQAAFLSQEVRLGKSFANWVLYDTILPDSLIRSPLKLCHTFEYDRAYRLYSDQQNASQAFYANNFIDTSITNDSTFYRSVKNTLQLKLDPSEYHGFLFRSSIAATFDFKRYAFNKPADTIVTGNPNDTIGFNGDQLVWLNKDTSYNTKETYSYPDHYLSGIIFGKYKNSVSLGLSGKLFFAGYHKGDYEMDMDFTWNNKWLVPLKFNAHAASSLKRPGFFMSRYSSNHYQWDYLGQFDKIVRTEAGVNLKSMNENLSASYHYALIKNYTYFSTDTMPGQYSGLLHVNTVSLDAHNKLWKFHFKNRVLLQKSSSNKVLSLPLFAIHNTTYFQSVIVENALKAQIGFEVFYHTPFHLPAFNPSYGYFYQQQVKKTGDYPYVNAFVNAKWKRTRILLKLGHATDLLPDLNRNYFSALHYPRNPLVFKIAIGWTFYN